MTRCGRGDHVQMWMTGCPQEGRAKGEDAIRLSHLYPFVPPLSQIYYLGDSDISNFIQRIKVSGLDLYTLFKREHHTTPADVVSLADLA